MLVSWLLFPLVFVALCLGCGLLLERCVGLRLPGLLLIPAGFVVLVTIATVTPGSASAMRKGCRLLDA